MALFAKKLETLAALYTEELRGLLSAESLQAEALPGFMEDIQAEELRKLITRHCGETRTQCSKLKRLLAAMDVKAPSGNCAAMDGLIQEAQGYMRAGGNTEVCEAALVSILRRIEHYEIAAYGSLLSMARRLNHLEDARQLEGVLQEEISMEEALVRFMEEASNARADRVEPDVSIF